jgi:hypothetical protein
MCQLSRLTRNYLNIRGGVAKQEHTTRVPQEVAYFFRQVGVI